VYPISSTKYKKREILTEKYPKQLLPQRGAPYASAILSMLYLCAEINMIGTPGTFRNRLLKSLSHVATM